MGWPNTPEGREKKKADQRRWWHRKNPDATYYPPRVGKDTDDKPITEDDKVIQDMVNQERSAQEPEELMSPIERLFKNIVVLRDQIKQLTEKRDSLRAQDFTNATGEFDKPLDDVERADAQRQENERVQRLYLMYNAAIIEKEEKRDSVKAQADALSKQLRDIKNIIKSWKSGTMDAHLLKLADDMATAERELAMHKAVLSDSPTHVQRVMANRGKRGAERQIHNLIQKKAALNRVIPEYEVMVSYLSGDFEGSRKITQQLEKQNVQLVDKLAHTPTGEEPVPPEEQPVYIQFLEPWGGYIENGYQRVSSLSEETAAGLVDANIAQYVEVVRRTAAEDAAQTAAVQASTGNHRMTP